MEATDILKKEHRAIEHVLDSMDRAADAIRGKKEVPPEVFSDGLDFIRTFADRCHHAKEEGKLFPLLVERGIPSQGGPIQVMLMEHEQGRAHVRNAAAEYEKWAEGDRAAGVAMANALQSYTGLLRDHIYKEDNILYPMADQVLSPADDQLLVKQFDDIEEHELGPGVHEKYHVMIDELEVTTARL